MGKRQLSSWNLFVMDLKKKNPKKSFGEVLKLASTLKKKGSNYTDFVKSKTSKAVKKIKKTLGVRKRKNKNRKTRKN